jgi:hypothetical protein
MNAAGLRVFRAIRENFEDVAAQDVVASCHSGAETGVADGNDTKVRRRDQIKTGGSLKQHLEIRLREIHGTCVQSTTTVTWQLIEHFARDSPRSYSLTIVIGVL